MTRSRTLYVPALLVAAAVLAVSGKAEATFPGKNGRFAYANYGGTSRGIYTINPDGGSRSRVTEGDEPSYSPNGEKIAYASWDGHDSEIYTINVGGRGKFQVTNNTTKDDEDPSYLPDGKKIAYTGYKGFGDDDDDEDFDHEIYTISVGGGDKSQVTDTKYWASNPSWGSR